MPSRRTIALLLLAAAVGGIQSAVGSEPPPPTFERSVRPILKEHCFHCHGEGEKLSGGVDLRLRRLMAGHATDGGVVLAPGDPDGSRMLQLARSGEMPKGEKKLAPEQLALIEAWIKAGAQTARDEPAELPKGFHITEEERHFWAFQPVQRPEIPRVAGGDSSRIRNPVDSFLLAKLREHGLGFAPEAGKRTLIRRASFDLVGLPPTPEEVEAFLADESDDAYDKLVDRLLGSERYGERWGRHWLDVAGYADSNGHVEADSPRPQAWRYRDYVIRSFNAGKPWDQFITEQLAGDELAGVAAENAQEKAANPQARELLEATGFLRMAPDGTGDEVPDQNIARNQVMAETVKIVSSSLLGLSVGCAECHDHRYDPISQEDYHRLRALLEPALDWKKWRAPRERMVSLYTAEDRQKAEAVEAQAREVDAEAERMRKEFLEKVFEREIAKLPEEVREAAAAARNTEPGKRSPEQVALLKIHPSADVRGALDLYDPESNRKVLDKQAEASKIRGTKPPEPFVAALFEPSGAPPATLLFHRGDHEQPRQAVEPGELEVLRGPGEELPKVEGLSTSGRRLAYARHLTSGRHPTVARVLVNRFWMLHMGRGLVSTPGDFGAQGELPTHPELLDWLASEFVEGGWKLKPLHKLIMISTAYRQASTSPASIDADPENRWLGRMKLRRFESEVLRDAILAVSGSLNAEQGGPALPVASDEAGRIRVGRQKNNGNNDPVLVDPIGPAAFRRSVYVEVRRSKPLTVLEAFDAPVMTPNCEARDRSAVTPQALTLLNDTFVAEQSLAFAQRLMAGHPGDLEKQIDHAWLLAYGAPPTRAELDRSMIYLAGQAERLRARASELAKAAAKDAPAPPDAATLSLASFCQALLASNRFIHTD